MYTFSPAYPTPEHAAAADAIVQHFAGQAGVAAVLLTCSCARGKATADSCLDIAVFLDPATADATRNTQQRTWQQYLDSAPVFRALQQVGRFSHVDLDFFDGHFTTDAHHHGWTTGPDAFELEIGNRLVYTVPLWERNETYRQLQAAWLPYYDEGLRQVRLTTVRDYCVNNLEHIDLYVARGLHFQALQRLWHAAGEFLQALFIARRTYPIAYDKWIREQVVEVLGMPDLYTQLTSLFEIERFESDALARKARLLRRLVDEHLTQ
ncbi:MAG: hypothetical protein KDE19_02740 [Caldilineaceae bacterium]|nr:hypothetical protein [Caldilineaceae bacterium]